MIKRYISGILMLVLLLTLLAACGGDQPVADPTGFRIITATPKDTPVPSATPTPVVPVLDAADLEGIELVFWYASDPTGRDLIGDLVAQFNAENELGVTIFAVALENPGELVEAMDAVLGTSQMPDIVLAEPYQYLPWVEKGHVVDLTPYLDSDAYGLPIEAYYTEILWRDTYPDGRWGFPGLFNAQVMLYNRTWAAELGFELIPKTTTAFQRQACIAHQATDDHTGGWIIDRSSGGAVAWILSFEQFLDQLMDFKSRQVEAAYTFLSGLYTEGCAWYSQEQYPDQEFTTRQGLFYAVNSRELGYVAESFDLAGSDDDWMAIGYPNPQGEPIVSLSGESYIVLDKTVPRSVASWLFIRYLTGPESQTALAESGLYLPLDRETGAELQEDLSFPSAWRETVALLDQGVAEPPIQQWGVLRSVLQDAQAEVMDDRFVPGTMSLFLDRLDKLVEEIRQ